MFQGEDEIMFTKVYQTALVLAAAALFTGCGLPPDEEGADQPIEVTQQKLSLGNWAGPFFHGDFPADAFRATHLSPVCEGRIGSQSHAGWLHQASCKFEWNGKVQFHGNYKVLMPPASGRYELMDSPGFIPDNAVMTDHDSGLAHNGFPVCLGAGVAWGKVQNNHCKFEYGKRVHSAPHKAFRYLVHVQ